MGVQVVHPLVHENTSDGLKQLFTSRLSRHEFFLQNHKIKEENRPKRINLPTFPFAKEKYWISQINPEIKTAQICSLSAIPVWEERPALLKNVVKNVEHIVLLYTTKIEINKLQALMPEIKYIKWVSREKRIDSKYIEYAMDCFSLLQDLMKKERNSKVLIQVITEKNPNNDLLMGLAALLKTAHLENPKIIGQIIQIENETAESLVIKLEENKNQLNESTIKYQNNQRFIASWKKLIPSDFTVKPHMVFKNHGVYLITGGLGKLGVLFAKEIFAKTTSATLILIGKSELSNKKQEVLQELQRQGTVEYFKLDVSSNLTQVISLVESIYKDHKTLNGIIHSAGIISDNLIFKKTPAEFKSVLSSKVTGSYYLDMATKNKDIDFFVLFSSISGVTGNVGQADYATANAFMDQFATYRNVLVSKGKRKGHTLSINWPLWKDGGMTISEEMKEIVYKSTGMVEMETQTGIRAFYEGMCSSHSQFAVIEGIREKIRNFSWSRSDDVNTLQPHATLEATQQSNNSVAVEVIKIIANLTQISVNQINTSDDLLSLGVNSFLRMEFQDKLIEIFDISISIFEISEVKNIQECINLVQSKQTKANADIFTYTSAHKVHIPDKVHIPEKLPKTAFVLSAPRSGSTLFRLVLNAHSHLFSPPELYLLEYETMQQRNVQLQRTPPLKEGLIDAIIQASGEKIEDAIAKVHLLEEQNMEVYKVYQYLQELVKPKLLVDKTPGYAKNINILRNAESLFANPVYLYLYRHPLAMMGSFVKVQFHRVFGARGSNPWKIAEKIWYQFNHTVQEFFKEIPDQRKMLVCYEDLVTQPQEVLPAICRLLDIEFEKNMCFPYDNNVNKLGGLHPTSMMIGDPNITKHKKIDQSMATSWIQYKDHWPLLDDKTKALAQTLGYSSEGIQNKKNIHIGVELTKKNSFPELEILQQGDKLPPLVLLPSLFGNASLYSQLSKKLGKRMPVFALNGIEKFRSFPDFSLFDIAAYYTQQLIEFFAKENIQAFHLGGFSFGGILSYEILRQMQIREQKIRSILIIDSACPVHDFHQLFSQGDKNNHQIILDIARNGLFKRHSIIYSEKQLDQLAQISSRDHVIQEIVDIAIKNGVKGNREAYIECFQNTIAIAHWHYTALSEYKIKKLPDPESVICHYFRRKNWNNFYKTEPNLKKQNQYIRKVNSRYQKQDPFAAWSLFLPQFKSYITSSEQHYDLLTNPKSVEQISDTMYHVYQTIKE